MCEACVPRMSRRAALLLAGGAAAGAFSVTGAAAAVGSPTGYDLTIQPRETWAGDSRPPTGELGGEEVRFLLVHHTATPNGSDPIGTMRGVYNFHTSAEKGWPDVAYNFFIDQDGVVYEARTGSLSGAVEASATGGNQGFAQLVCLLGDFTAQNPTDAALRSLTATLAWLADRYGLDTSEAATATFISRGSNRWPQGSEVTTSIIAGHRDMSQTACPGDTFYPYLVANVRADVHELRTGQAPASPSSSAPPDTVTEPAATAEAAPAPESSTTAPFPESTTSAPSSSVTETTTAPTVASGTVDPPPPPASDAADVTESSGDSANGSALAVAAGAAVVVGAGAVYVGLRGRSDDAASVDD